MLCFRCGSFCSDDSTKCGVCSQSFVDDTGRLLEQVDRASTSTNMPASIFVVGERASDRYKIIDVLGYGGVGIAYRAKDEELDTAVVLKAISPNLMQTEDEQKEFQKNMRACRKLHHPNIVRVYDTGVDGSRRFYTMEFLDGLSLKKIIKLRHENGEAFTPEEIVPIFEQLASALDYAHRSTWHGNLKPENVVVLPEVLKITDFNLVKALPLKPFLATAKTRTSGYPYLAPELRKESSKVDGSVDIYSLGVILGKMLTGIVFEGHFPKALKSALEALPAELETVFRKSVSELPQNRFASAGELARDLEAALKVLPERGLPPPFGARKVSNESTLLLDMATPPPPPMETDPGAGVGAPPLPNAKEPSRDEPTVKADVLGDTTIQEEKLIAERTLAIEERFPELSQAEDPGPPPAPFTSEESDPVFNVNTDDYVISKEGLANLKTVAATNEGAPLDSPPMSDDEWGDLNPTLAENVTMTEAGVSSSPLEPTATLEVNIGAISENDLDLAAIARPVLPTIETPPAPSNILSPPADMPPLPKEEEDFPSWTMGLGAVVLIAGAVFFGLVQNESSEPALELSSSIANEPEATGAVETVPGDKDPAQVEDEGSAPAESKKDPKDNPAPSVEEQQLADTVPANLEQKDEVGKDDSESAVAETSQPEPEIQPPPVQKTEPPKEEPQKEETAPEPQKVAAVANKELSCLRGMKMVKEGGFQFGSSSSDPMRNFGEKLASRRQTHSYCIDYYEYPNGAKKKPTVGVSWNKAKSICEGKGKRLCTELEWERACKGTSNLRFPYGNQWEPAKCNTENEEGIPGTLGRAVDFKKCKSTYRIYNLAGNAEEWTSDSYSSGSNNKVVKGGSANRPDWASRCAARRAQNPRTSATMLGFRCCVDPQ